MTALLAFWNACLLAGLGVMSVRHHRARRAWGRERDRLRRELDDVKQAAWENFEEADRLAERLAAAAPADYRARRVSH